MTIKGEYMENEVRIGEREFDLGLFLRVFKRYWILLLVVTMVFGVVGAVYTFLYEDDVYQGSVSFWVNGASNNVSQSATMGAAQMATNYAELVNKDMLLRRAVQNDALNEKWSCSEDDAVKAIKSMISAGKSSADSFVFSVSIRYTDADVVYDAISAVQYAMVEVVAEVNNDYSGTGSTKYITLINEIHSPDDVVKNGRSYLANVILAAIGAFVVCYIVCFIIVLGNKKVYDLNSLSGKLCCAVGAVVSDKKKSSDVEAFTTDLEYCFVNVKNPVVAVNYDLDDSSSRAIGKELAAEYSRKGRKTLFIDMDIYSRFASAELAESKGFSDYLGGDTDVRPVNTEEGLDVIPAGTLGSITSVHHSLDKIGELISSVRSSYDIIIVDTPPAREYVDAGAVSALCDGCLLVALRSKSTVAGVEKSAEQLRASGANVVAYTIVDRK